MPLYLLLHFFWVVTLCSRVTDALCFERMQHLLLWCLRSTRRIFSCTPQPLLKRKVVHSVKTPAINKPATQPRRTESSTAKLWEPQISHQLWNDTVEWLLQDRDQLQALVTQYMIFKPLHNMGHYWILKQGSLHRNNLVTELVYSTCSQRISTNLLHCIIYLLVSSLTCFGVT